MGRTLSFIHAADVHLGAPFRGLGALSERWAQRLTRAIPEAFDRLVRAAIERRVDFVLLAGDVFDTANPSYADFLVLIEGFERLRQAGIAAYLCTGNHDPYTSWQSDFATLPANVHMLPADRPGFLMHEREGEPLCMIGSRGYYNQTFPQDARISEGVTRSQAERALGRTAPFFVGMLHTGLDLDPLKAPSRPADLRAAGADYWALGHIHQPYQDDPRAPRIAFSGCIQGRDMKETGPRGCWHVRIGEGELPRAEFLPLASVAWQRTGVDVSSCQTLSEVGDAIMRRLFTLNGQARCEEMVVRVTLEGTTRLHGLLARDDIRAQIRDGLNDRYPIFFCDALLDGTRAPRDAAALEREGLFPAIVLRESRRVLSDDCAAQELVQAGYLERRLVPPSGMEPRLGRIRERALEAALDALEGEGE